ncbi:unnamed protein product [Schistosoma turkestanicum]|nr:unnamed protein product [Schistosoma turkestanicum]
MRIILIHFINVFILLIQASVQNDEMSKLNEDIENNKNRSDNSRNNKWISINDYVECTTQRLKGDRGQKFTVEAEAMLSEESNKYDLSSEELLRRLPCLKNKTKLFQEMNVETRTLSLKELWSREGDYDMFKRSLEGSIKLVEDYLAGYSYSILKQITLEAIREKYENGLRHLNK